MKVLELFGEPISNGGQESFVINVLKHIRDDEIKVDFLTPYFCDNQAYAKIVQDRGGQVFSLNLPFLPGKSRFNIKKPLKKFFNSNHYDVVHIHSGSISILAVAAYVARKCKINRVIVHSHCAAERKTFKYRITKFVSLPFMKLYPTDYCACSRIAGEWKFSKNIVKKKLVILKNGVDLEDFAFNGDKRNLIREKLNISSDTLVLGHVGRFSYQKNHEYLLKVFKELKNRHINSKLMLIGSGELLNEVKGQAKNDNILNDIIFVGNVNNVHDYMQAFDVFALPSRFEGLPIVGVEAQASGLPCVFSIAVTDETMLTDKVKFLPVNETSVSVWVDSILELYGTERKDNSEVLREKGFDINQTADTVVAIYKKANLN